MHTILLQNAAICDATQWYKRGDVLVRDGQIAEIGAIAGAVDEIYDLTDYTLLPGLFDAHVHIVTGPIEYNDISLKNWAMSGVTTVRDMGLGNARPLEDYLAWRNTVEVPECAQILTCGRCVAADHGYMHIMGHGDENGIGVKTPAQAAAAVDKLYAAGVDGIKTAMDLDMFREDTPQHSPETIRTIAEKAAEHQLWCAAHVLMARFVPILVENGIPELAHMPLELLSDELLEEMVAKGVAVTPTLCSINAPRPPIPAGDVPPEMRRVMERMESIDTAEQERIAIDNVRRFHAKGGVVAVGTDTMRMESLPRPVGVPVNELRLLHSAGLSVQEVLAAATLNSARVCKVDARLGSVEVGKQANLIAVRSPLDESFDALTHVEFVLNRGVVIKNI
ncbi:MAG: hypothetical protein H6Q60_221 [Oscillospiraceae bacterium]|nr:hypothetical protein [Oscillospiraceae bacterium]